MKLNQARFFILIAVITTIIYYFQHVRNAEYVYEDTQWAAANSYHWSISDAYTVKGNRLTLLSFTHNTPVAAHAINLAIHIVNSVSLALLCEAWFSGVGWIVGCFFLVNPLSTQAIAYAAGRGELLSLMFLLGFLWFSTVSSFNNVTRWILIFVCVYGMFMTKATTLVVCLPLIMFVYLCDNSITHLPGLGISIILSVFAIPFIVGVYYTHIVVYSSMPLKHWIGSQSYATWRLLFEAITGRGLAIDHPWWLASNTIQILSVIAGVFIIGLFLPYIILMKDSSAIIFGIGWWFITFTPRIFATVTLGWIREQHTYTPLVGFCIALAAGLELLERKRNYGKPIQCEVLDGIICEEGRNHRNCTACKD